MSNKVLTEEQKQKRREAAKRWRDKNPEKVVEANRRWAEENREKLLAWKRAKAKEYVQTPENRAAKNLRNREYYREHREQILSRELTREQKERKRETERRWREGHLEEHRAKSREYARQHESENRARAKEWVAKNLDRIHSLEARERRREYSARYRLKHPDKVKAYTKRWYEEKGREVYLETRNGRRMPGGLCDLCGREETALARGSTGEKRSLQQDHCHATGVHRGLLCLDCNRALGAFKDNPELMRRAAEYIERYRVSPDDYSLAEDF